MKELKFLKNAFMNILCEIRIFQNSDLKNTLIQRKMETYRSRFVHESLWYIESTGIIFWVLLYSTFDVSKIYKHRKQIIWNFIPININHA